MRSISANEISMVSGGRDGSGSATNASAAREAAINQCKGLPDNTKVTFTIQISSNVSGKVAGVGGEATTVQTVEVETTCGDLRKTT